MNAQHFQRGSGVFKCRTCGHNTRNVGDNGQVQLCILCFDLSGEENSLSDNGEFYSSTANITSMVAALDKQSGAGTAQRIFPEIVAELNSLHDRLNARSSSY